MHLLHKIENWLALGPPTWFKFGTFIVLFILVFVVDFLEENNKRKRARYLSDD